MLQQKHKGPRFVAFIGPVLDALRELGSSAKPKEIYELVAKNLTISDEELEVTNKNGRSNFENKIGWAKFYLAKAGYVGTEQHGIWVLTDTGKNTHLNHEASYKLFREIHNIFSKRKQQSSGEQEKDGEPQLKDDEEDLAENVGSAPDESLYINENRIREELVDLLRKLSDVGFEELSARLLRHIGFENVHVTSRSRDGGIDGIADLPINRFVRTKVMFQCKRYEKTVGPEKIRDFRGALQGRADRGIFLTTGIYTRGAQEEAVREGAMPVELVDIDGLIDLLIEESLGVQKTQALVIDVDFFKPYQK